MMESGGKVAMVMREEHATSPRGCTPRGGGELTQGWGDGRRGVQYYLLLLDMAY